MASCAEDPPPQIQRPPWQLHLLESDRPNEQAHPCPPGSAAEHSRVCSPWWAQRGAVPIAGIPGHTAPAPRSGHRQRRLRLR
jgi:hypothetical protein